MIKIVSPGEITAGMYIVGYETEEEKLVSEGWMAPPELKKVVTRNPWFKGIPMEVSAVAGPIIAVKNPGIKEWPPIVFFDSRIVKFFEVSKRFYKKYFLAMTQAPAPAPTAPDNSPCTIKVF